ncbi:DUF2092 domain-containing protein [Streptomyces sp. XM4193]|uniref:LolA family protein n=1 Tax=Streptomyces sp. XM4193 TaxID=2929782 RepID=UPI001FF76062|nr:sigma-E factor regulatory protein RseB domain-containing protein [Streptomyces sp. XM4193]MCK1796682.1 DUF2092 domain-containing protein [Streptomyces sp. XM4193]
MTGTEDTTGSTDAAAPRPRRRAARYAVPVAVLTVAVASIGLVPALADNGDPDLPSLSAEELVAKIAESDVEHFSGTVKTRADLGLPGGSLQDMLPSGDPSLGDSAAGDVDASARLASLLTGKHTVDVAVDGPEKQRATLKGDRGSYTMVHNDGSVWGYDSESKTAFRGEAPDGADRKGAPEDALPKGANPQQLAKELLDRLEDTTTVSVQGTTRVADRDAYQLAVKPKGAPDSTIDALRIAVDAENGVPLKVTLDARGGGDPIGEVAFQDVDFGKPAASTFDFTPPKGTTVIDEEELAKHRPEPGDALGSLPGLEEFPGIDALLDGKHAKDGKHPEGLKVLGKGWNTVLVMEAPESAKGEKAQELPEGGRMGKLLDAYTDRVEGDFGKGRVVGTKVVNALLTDDGSVYVGAVTKEGLIKAANAG